MKVASLSLPHPVLGVSDDVSGAYNVVNPTIHFSRDEITMQVTHRLSNATLESMISSGKACYCVEINCLKTFYRETFFSISTTQDIKIKSSLLRDRVDCTFYITTAEDIPNYRNADANADYSGYDFYVSKGDVLAFGGTTYFLAEKEWQAYRSIASFMEIRKDDRRDKGPFEIDLAQEKIIIQLAKEDYDRYNPIHRAEHVSAIFHSAIVLPALIYAVSQLISDRTNAYADLKWYEMLQFRKRNDPKLRDLDWDDPTTAPKIAQIILDDPLMRTLNDIDALITPVEE